MSAGGILPMGRGLRLLVLGAVFASSSAVLGLENGDIDGDGRLSIRDVVEILSGGQAVPGSLDGFVESLCFEPSTAWYEKDVASAVYLECLRRGVEDPFPHYFGIWPEGLKAEPLPPDDSVEISLLPLEIDGGTTTRSRLVLDFLLTEEMRAFSLILETPDSILRPAEWDPEEHISDWSSPINWRWQSMSHPGWFEDIYWSTPIPAYLITRGKLVITFNMRDGANPWRIGPGRFVLETPVRVPLGAKAGTYEVRLSPWSEVLLSSGRLIAPVASGAGEVVIREDVTAGYREDIPPLLVDNTEHKILGQVEFRMVNGDGEPARAGEPIASVAPGESFRVRVQMRSEVPLNDVGVWVQWPDKALGPVDGNRELTYLFRNPEDGQLYSPALYDGYTGCVRGRMHRQFKLAGAPSSAHAETYPNRPLEYFKPLGAWTDLFEVDLVVDQESTGARSIPLKFFHQTATDFVTQFAPFYEHWWCSRDSFEEYHYYTYDIRYHDAVVEVLSDDPPPPPPDVEIDVELGDASGPPGSEVEVPVLAVANAPVGPLQLALSLDAGVATAEELDVFVRGIGTDVVRAETVRPGEWRIFPECVDTDGDGIEDWCMTPDPNSAYWPALEPEQILVRIYPVLLGVESVEIAARLRLRIADRPTASEAVLRAAVIPYTWDPLSFPEDCETGGFFLEEDDSVFVRAAEVMESVIRVLRPFLRGDSNDDGKVDLSDAVATLGNLFLGTGELPCLDAADANDNGTVDISDPIFVLMFLFVSGEMIPEPFPSCGNGSHELGCRESRCPLP